MSTALATKSVSPAHAPIPARPKNAPQGKSASKGHVSKTIVTTPAVATVCTVNPVSVLPTLVPINNAPPVSNVKMVHVSIRALRSNAHKDNLAPKGSALRTLALAYSAKQGNTVTQEHVWTILARLSPVTKANSACPKMEHVKTILVYVSIAHKVRRVRPVSVSMLVHPSVAHHSGDVKKGSASKKHARQKAAPMDCSASKVVVSSSTALSPTIQKAVTPSPPPVNPQTANR